VRVCVCAWITGVLLIANAPLAVTGPPLRAGVLNPQLSQLLPGPVRDLAPGKLLVAARDLLEPSFAESVVLLTDHNEKGSVGLIVNRVTKVPVSSVLPDVEPKQGTPALIYFGGPVEGQGVMALLRSDQNRPGSRRIFADVFLITERALLDEMMSSGSGEGRVRVYVGYSGWSPGQLARETAQGAWHVIDGDPGLIFDADPDTLWEREIRRAGERVASRPWPAIALITPPAPRPNPSSR
jgi:putative transcriptional regulator